MFDIHFCAMLQFLKIDDINLGLYEQMQESNITYLNCNQNNIPMTIYKSTTELYDRMHIYRLSTETFSSKTLNNKNFTKFKMFSEYKYADS